VPQGSWLASTSAGKFIFIKTFVGSTFLQDEMASDVIPSKLLLMCLTQSCFGAKIKYLMHYEDALSGKQGTACLVYQLLVH